MVRLLFSFNRTDTANQFNRFVPMQFQAKFRFLRFPLYKYRDVGRKNCIKCNQTTFDLIQKIKVFFNHHKLDMLCLFCYFAHAVYCIYSEYVLKSCNRFLITTQFEESYSKKIFVLTVSFSVYIQDQQHAIICLIEV